MRVPVSDPALQSRSAYLSVVIMSRPAEAVHLWSWKKEESFPLKISIEGDSLL